MSFIPNTISASAVLNKGSFGRKYVCSALSGDYTINLPPIDGEYAGSFIKFIVSKETTGTITLDAGSNLIDNAQTLEIKANQVATLQNDGTKWTTLNSEFAGSGGGATINDAATGTDSTWSANKIQATINSASPTGLINDSATGTNSTWSSNKIKTELNSLSLSGGGSANINDSITASGSTWSSQKINSQITGLIDDSQAATGTTWSSSKILATAISGVVIVSGVMSPVNEYPVNNAINMPQSLVLTASPYLSVLGYTQELIQVQISTSTNFDTPFFTDTVYDATTSYTVSSGVLSLGTTYHWRVRYKEQGGVYSAWSSATAFTTSLALTVDTPMNVQPTNGQTNLAQNPMLMASAFSASGDTHDLSEWQVTTVAGNYSAPAWQSGWTATNLTNITINYSANLQPNTTYYWRVRYHGANLGWSAWSSETSFSTSTTFDIGTILYVACAGQNPTVKAQVRNGDDFSTALGDPATPFSGNFPIAAISPDSKLIVGATDTSFGTLSSWKRNGSNISFLNNYSISGSTNRYTGDGAWSPNGNYLSIGGEAAAGVGTNENIFKRNNDDTLTALAITGQSTAAGNTISPAWSPDNSHLFFNLSVSPFYTLWKNMGSDVFTKLPASAFDTQPTGVTSIAGSVITKSAAYSPDGTMLAIAQGATPFLRIYTRSGDNYTMITSSNITGTPAVAHYTIAWSPDSQILYTGHIASNSTVITAYQRNADTFTKISSSALSANNFTRCNSITVSNDGQYIAIALAATPWVKIFKYSGGVYTALTFTAPFAAATRFVEFDRDTM